MMPWTTTSSAEPCRLGADPERTVRAIPRPTLIGLVRRNVPLGNARLCWCLGLLKIVYLSSLLGVLLLWGDLEQIRFYAVNQRWPRDGGPAFASHFATWDAAHYLYLSEVGYVKGVPSCAFYPLWPLMVRWCSPLFGISHLLAGLLLANVFSLAGWALFHRLVAGRWGEKTATHSLAFLIAFPGALFFQFNYSESLFFLLVVLLWWGLEKERNGCACLAAAVLPLARGVGVFGVLPIAWRVAEPAGAWLRERVRVRRGKGRDQNSVGVSFPFHAVLSRAWLLAAPLTGWTAYLALMWHWTGNAFQGFEAQKHWDVHSISNLWNLPKFVAGFFLPTDWHAFRGSVLDRSSFMLLLYCLPVIWKLDKGLLVWSYVLGILPAMSGTFTSFTRFACCAFPMFIALGVFLSRPEHRSLRYGLLAVFVTLHVVLIWRFVNFRWAG